MRKKQLKTKGFTLIELIVVMVILGIIAAGSSELVLQGFNAYFAEQNIIAADWQGYYALERMERDLHSMRSSADIISATSNSIAFIDISDSVITYQLAGTQLQCNVTVGGQSNNQVLADGIHSLTLQYFDSSGNDLGAAPQINLIRYIVITLNVNYGNTNFNLTTGVYPWNLF